MSRSLGQGVEPLDGVLRLDQRRRRADRRSPCGRASASICAHQSARRSRRRRRRWRFQAAIRSASTLAGVADDADVGPHDLADRRGVDVDVDLLRAGREGVQPAGHPVVEARADADHHVAVVHGVVGLEGAVHADHAQPGRVVGREGAQAHQGRGHRRAGQGGELAQQPRWPPGPALITPPPV